MGFRITTWNVNGIRNPFSYQPWRDKRTFDAMFDILEADIVIMQELKIQRKDLRDDMVLIPGWDCYFSLPRFKKGYSGVGIYTRQSTCSPVRAEEGISGVLCPPGSIKSYRDLPDPEQIGGYPTTAQLHEIGIDPSLLDAEGRCVILEFDAFVILGCYSPANSNGMRADYRRGFLEALDARVRNLIAVGKNVIVTGDLNISREEIDSAGSLEDMKKEGISHEDYLSTPNRRVFNQLLEDGQVYGPRDSNRERPALWDVCRGFHPGRKGMYTHWEQKINARPGNYGSRIDFILCSLNIKSWFESSDIQEGLMGSDHCPVYAVIKDKVEVCGSAITTNRALRELLNPFEVVVDSDFRAMTSQRRIPAFSAKLLPEFDRRRSIKDMFFQKKTPALCQKEISAADETSTLANAPDHSTSSQSERLSQNDSKITKALPSAKNEPMGKEDIPENSQEEKKRRMLGDSVGKRTLKRARSDANMTDPTTTNTPQVQKTLRGFFQVQIPKLETQMQLQSTVKPELTYSAQSITAIDSGTRERCTFSPEHQSVNRSMTVKDRYPDVSKSESGSSTNISDQKSSNTTLTVEKAKQESGPDESPGEEGQDMVFDPIVSKESWGKLFQKPRGPRCEDHGELCKMMRTKKPGFNCGREFWMCARPLGPSGSKERNTHWRCPTFIWSSDWNGTG